MQGVPLWLLGEKRLQGLHGAKEQQALGTGTRGTEVLPACPPRRPDQTGHLLLAPGDKETQLFKSWSCLGTQQGRKCK